MKHATRFLLPLVLLLSGLLPCSSAQAQEGGTLPGPQYTNCYPTLRYQRATGKASASGTTPVMPQGAPLPGGGGTPPTKSSVYGGALTPRGTLKVLVIFAGFTNDVNIQSPDYYDLTGDNPWPQEDGIHSPGLSFPKDPGADFYTSLASFQPGAQDNTLSNFYYQMSRLSASPFKMQAVFFPKRINITATDQDNVSGVCISTPLPYCRP